MPSIVKPIPLRYINRRMQEWAGAEIKMKHIRVSCQDGGIKMATDEKGNSTYRKLDIAIEYLDLAMQQYMSEQNYFCCIHLAAAAEELFGRHLRDEERIHTISVKAQQVMHLLEAGDSQKKNDAKKVLLNSKNSVKHMSNDGDNAIDINLVAEAEFWIEQALINFHKLGYPKSKTLWRFEDYQSNSVKAIVRP